MEINEKAKSWLFLKSNKTDNPLANQPRKNQQDTNFQNQE